MTVDKAIHGTRALAPHELLSLQASMYQYTELMSVSAKMVDGVVSAIKTVTTEGS